MPSWGVAGDIMIAAGGIGLWFLFVFTCLIPWVTCDPDAYLAARRRLNALDLTEAEAGVFEETPEFLAANAAVGDAEAGVPFWLRWSIDRRVLREQDYWARLDAALARHGRDPSC